MTTKLLPEPGFHPSGTVLGIAMVTYLGFLPRAWQLLPCLAAEHTARGVTHSTHDLKSFSCVFLEHFRIVQTCVWNGGHVSSCVMLCFHEKMWGLTNCPGASGRGGARSCWCDPWPPRDSPLPPLTASASWRALSDAPISCCLWAGVPARRHL